MGYNLNTIKAKEDMCRNYNSHDRNETHLGGEPNMLRPIPYKYMVLILQVQNSQKSQISMILALTKVRY